MSFLFFDTTLWPCDECSDVRQGIQSIGTGLKKLKIFLEVGFLFSVFWLLTFENFWEMSNFDHNSESVTKSKTENLDTNLVLDWPPWPQGHRTLKNFEIGPRGPDLWIFKDSSFFSSNLLLFSFVRSSLVNLNPEMYCKNEYDQVVITDYQSVKK